MDYKLICFDIDGTIADRDSTELYPEAQKFFEEYFIDGDVGKADVPTIALVTNQGGPACRDAGWPWSDKYPSLDDVNKRLEAIVDNVNYAALHTTLHRLCLCH